MIDPERTESARRHPNEIDPAIRRSIMAGERRHDRRIRMLHYSAVIIAALIGVAVVYWLK